MKPDRWAKIEEIFNEAVELSGNERSAFLDRACRVDSSLRQEVESLIARTMSADGALHRMVGIVAAEAAAAAAPDLVGQTVGHYRIASLAGAGGMGKIYRARDEKLKRDVAIKTLSAEFSNDRERLARFQREAEVLAAINHPHIAAIYDLEEFGNSRLLVMEFVEGDTLADLIARGALPASEALTIARQIAEALEAAHEKGIVHRDLKPDNIKITPGGNVKVLDFGLAKVREPQGGAPNLSNSPTVVTLSQQNVILGTAAYMSPEQAKGLAVDHRSDIFSFGCVLYEMLTGKQPFEGQTVSDLLASVMTRAPDLSRLPAGVNPKIVDLIRRCLNKDMKRRWQAAGDLRVEIEDILAHRESREAPAPAASPVASRAAWLVALIAVAAAASIGTYLTRPTPQAEAVRFTIQAPPGTSFRSLFAAYGRRAVRDPWPSLSPDGKKLAFVARSADSKLMIWIRDLNSLSPQMLAGTEGATVLFWSPDGKHLGFVADGKLKKIDAVGGPATILCDSLAATPTWGSDDTILFDYDDTIHSVPSSGGQSKQITTVDKSRQETSHRGPYFLPDGRHFLFNVNSPKAENRGIYLASIDGKEKKQLLTESGDIVRYSAGYLVYQRKQVLTAQRFDLKSLALVGDPLPIGKAGAGGWFSASLSGALAYRAQFAVKTRLVWVDRSGTTIGTLGEDGDYLDLDLSPDGRTLAVQSDDGRIRLLDSIRGTVTPLTFDPARAPSWSPNGKKILFSSSRNGQDQMFQRNSDGTGHDEPVLTTTNPSVPMRVSRDDKFLLYEDRDPKTKSDLWILPLSGERTPRPVVQTPYYESFGDISPDGRWIAYQSDETGRFQISVQPIDGTAQWKISDISTSTSEWPLWSASGKELFYVANGADLMVADVSVGNSPPVGIPRKLFSVPSIKFAGFGRHFGVTPDSQRFIFETEVDDPNSWQITVVTNWLADAKK